MREFYEKQLKRLNQYIEEMGLLIEKAIEDSIRALLEHDKEEAQETIRYDSEINNKEREIENLCLNLLLSQQPVATDLRIVSAAMKMVTDMERIGDHAADIAEITLLLEASGYPNDLTEVEKMAGETIYMVKESVDAYMITKYLERIGDHATNIAEWVLFYITGEHPQTPV